MKEDMYMDIPGSIENSESQYSNAITIEEISSPVKYNVTHKSDKSESFHLKT